MLTASKPETGANDHVAADVSSDGSWARRIDTVVRSLQARLGVGIDPALIRTEVEAEFATYVAARVGEFVPILVETRVHGACAGSSSRDGLAASVVDEHDGTHDRLSCELQRSRTRPVSKPAPASTSCRPIQVESAAKQAGLDKSTTAAVVDDYETAQLRALKAGLLGAAFLALISLAFTGELPHQQPAPRKRPDPAVASN